MKRYFTMCAVVIALSLGSAVANAATLTGNTVGAEFRQPNSSTVQSSAGTAVVNGLQIFTIQHTFITVTASQIVFGFQSSANFPVDPFSGLDVYDLTSPFTAVSLASTNVSGLVPADVFLSGGYVFLNLQGLPLGSSSSVVLNVFTALTAPVVSEPASITILGASLIGLGLSRRRKQLPL